MLVTVCLNIKSTNGSKRAILHRDFQTSIIPLIGADFEDATFKEPKKIIQVTCNFSGDYYYVDIETINCGSDQNVDEFVDICKLHGWTDK